jgi:DNA-binding IclR family transcriptional regulator
MSGNSNGDDPTVAAQVAVLQAVLDRPPPTRSTIYVELKGLDPETVDDAVTELESVGLLATRQDGLLQPTPALAKVEQLGFIDT